ncbi:MAG: virulence protein RhuM/Fic/DOC family protein [Deltaproteobacteria bacterium]|nr:virulence protein RhuM/Fic/DOC family protein [Deltaproteobacteria bacterium]
MNEILIYQNEDNNVQVEVRVEDETVWLTQPQIVALFNSSKANISEHIRNIIESGELDAESTVRKFRTVQTEGARKVSRERPSYNLDMIISIGYRVNSKRGTQFRIWANNVIKMYLLKGYAVNEKRLSEREKELQTLKASIQLLERSIMKQAQQLDQAKSFVNIIADFSNGLGILDDYDNQRLDNRGLTEKEAAVISYRECKKIIGQVKDEFKSALFGKEKDNSFRSSIGQIYQTFEGRNLYPSIEEKAAVLLYLVVKNHSFVDGNKRIAAAIFLYFLDRNGLLYRQDKTTLIDGNTLASITLMIAESNPSEMETIKRIIMSILNRSKKF